MRVFICGIDGYLGWTLAMYLSVRGHEVAGADSFLRRKWVEEVGGHSAIPIVSMNERLEAYKEVYGKEITFWEGDLCNYDFVLRCLKEFQPEAIVHLGEQPCAPYSQIDVEHCVFTQHNNIVGTLNLLWAMTEVCPQAHLVKLGTMGEYGTPNIDIPEGFFTIEYRGRKDTLPFPKQAGSWYHQTKVHDTHNIMFACKIWNLRSTDLMQGVVYGTKIEEMNADERLSTRFDFDEAFGTVINRYCAQAVIGHTLTPYGKGGQTRGFIHIADSMRCMELTAVNPPEIGEYRVFNQWAERFDVTTLAQEVKKAGEAAGIKVEVKPIDNPRVEAEKHYYNPDHQKLFDLGFRPHKMVDMLPEMISDLMKHKDRIEAKREHILPTIKWRRDGAKR